MWGWAGVGGAFSIDAALACLNAYGAFTPLIFAIAVALYLIASRGLGLLGRRSRLPLATVATLRILTRRGFVLLTAAALLQS